MKSLHEVIRRLETVDSEGNRTIDARAFGKGVLEAFKNIDARLVELEKHAPGRNTAAAIDTPAAQHEHFIKDVNGL